MSCLVLSFGQYPRQRPKHPGIGDLREFGLGHSHQGRVAYRTNRRGPRRIEQHPELPDHLTTAQLGHHFVLCAVAGEDLQAAAAHHVERIGHIARVEQIRACLQLNLLRVRPGKPQSLQQVDFAGSLGGRGHCRGG
ncbi:Uncharacterised protein [Mycobacterium tuberculosis]|nr:Uncharacterised protein [Mycobacterium tuberculosis]